MRRDPAPVDPIATTADRPHADVGASDALSAEAAARQLGTLASPHGCAPVDGGWPEHAAKGEAEKARAPDDEPAEEGLLESMGRAVSAPVLDADEPTQPRRR